MNSDAELQDGTGETASAHFEVRSEIGFAE